MKHSDFRHFNTNSHETTSSRGLFLKNWGGGGGGGAGDDVDSKNITVTVNTF